LTLGLYEELNEDYLAAQLDDAGITYQSTFGGHCAFVDAQAMFS